jgi:hypothetical protein
MKQWSKLQQDFYEAWLAMHSGSYGYRAGTFGEASEALLAHSEEEYNEINHYIHKINSLARDP